MTDINSTREWYVIYVFERGWVVDTCAGGSYSDDFSDAKWWQSRQEALTELEASDLVVGLVEGRDYSIILNLR